MQACQGRVVAKEFGHELQAVVAVGQPGRFRQTTESSRGKLDQVTKSPLQQQPVGTT
jgi:hypothetical protein